MRTVDYIDVLNGTYDKCGIARASAQTTDFVRFRTFHTDRLRTAYQHGRWPELCRVEQRQYRNTWASGTTYAAADELFYPNSESYYVALRPSTGEEPDTDGVENSAYWAELGLAPATETWESGSVYAAGDRLINPSDLLTYQCHTAHTAGATFDATKFGVVPEFIRDVDYEQSWETNTIGDVIEVWDRNPRTQQNARAVEYEVENDRIIVLEEDVIRPWVQYRLSPPQLIGDPFSSTTAYSAGQQFYFESGTERGNFYDVITATTAGQTPLTHAAKFTKVEIPEMFGPYLKSAAFADWLPAEGVELERKAVADAEATRLLEREWIRASSQMQQRRRIKITVR